MQTLVAESPALGDNRSVRPLLLWIYDKIHQETLKGHLANIALLADIVPATSLEEASTILDLNASLRLVVTPGGPWLYGLLNLLRAKQGGLPVLVVFENCDHSLQRQYTEAGASFVAPHLEALRGYLHHYTAASQGGSAPLPLPFSPYLAKRSSGISTDPITWPQIGTGPPPLPVFSLQ